MTTKKNNKWPELGIITKNEVKDKDGKVVLGKDGKALTKLGFKLASNVTVLIDGKPVETSRYGVLKTPVEEVEGLIRNGAIAEDKVEERKDAAKKTYEWLRYKIQLTPPRET